MKEIQIKIRRMSEERLKTFQNGNWIEAYEVSIDNFKTFYKIAPSMSVGSLIDAFKQERGEL